MKYQLRQYQMDAVNAVYKALRERDDNPCVVLPTGCHAKDHPILMYDGTIRKVQDIKVGELIMGADSTPRKVLALARGHEQMAKIIPIKGEPFIVNVNHILSLVSTNEGKPNYPCYQKGGEITNITVKEYLTKSKSWKHLRKLYHVPVEFPNTQNLVIPPHILGMLIGDGTLTNEIGLTLADEELGDEFIEYAESIGCDIRICENDTGVPTYYAHMEQHRPGNPLIDMLFNLGLRGRCSENKFIPHNYLVASRDDRLQLLAGLIDTDGYYGEHTLEFTTKSFELACDVMFLIRSVGLMAHCAEKYASCQTGAGGWYYRINISGDISVIPCRRKRHVFDIRKMKKDVLRTGFSVELLPEDDFYGFELDGDHLYVDGNFFVHHNTGKSIVLAQIASDAVSVWGGRVLILAHVKELLEQNAEKIRSICDIPVGVYSAGLGSRDTDEPILVAGIQSVYNKAGKLGEFNLIITDECHLIAPEGLGMYRTFFKAEREINPNVRIIGLTATPYRTKGGLICSPDNIMNFICYEASVKDMIEQGYLSRLTVKSGKEVPDTDNLHVRAGEFVADEVNELMEDEKLVESACREIVRRTQDRKAVLIFCSSIRHCEMVKRQIERFSGEECHMITGNTDSNERAELLERFKGKQMTDLLGEPLPPVKYMVNVSVLTTGTDVPRIDCVVLLRPTMSPGLMQQMVGRGFRICEGKTDCLILDYGGNIMRHGPVDDVRIRKGKAGDGLVPMKVCPKCEAIIKANLRICTDCGHEFEKIQRERHLKHDVTASKYGILSGDNMEDEFDVMDMVLSEHEKRGDPSAPHTVRVSYVVSLTDSAVEFVCPEHTGYAREKFVKWWGEHAVLGTPVPETATEAVDLFLRGCVKKVTHIRVTKKAGETFERISRPVYMELDTDFRTIMADQFDKDPYLAERYGMDYGGDPDLPF